MYVRSIPVNASDSCNESCIESENATRTEGAFYPNFPFNAAN